jgi:hypothetical protein
MVGYSPRLNAVLRAGQVQFATTGAPGDKPAPVTKLTGPAAANALKKAASADSVMAKDPGAPPNLSKGKSTPAAPNGFQMRKGGGAKPVRVDSETGNQILAKSSEMVKDLIKDYETEQKDRVEALRKARAEGEACAERRMKAVDKFRDEEAKATADIIKKLETELKKVEKARDDLQNASDANLAKIDKMTKEGGESSKKVEELNKVIAQLKAEKESLEKELAAKVKSCNEERDVAAREAAAELKKLEAAWQLKLDECEKKADVESSKALKECTTKLEKAVADLEKETKAHNELEKSASEAAEKFKAAAKAACDALKEFTK